MMSSPVKITFLVTLLIFSLIKAPAQQVSFADTAAFYPNAERLKNQQISWGILSVPENWDSLNSKQIKIAVAILKNTSGISNAEGVVFIQGGPGASGVQNIFAWLEHPLREKHDIIFFDPRGTGFSTPRLCPDLGRKLLQIFAKNQSGIEDEKQKVAAAMSCRQSLEEKGIDLNAYHSQFVAKDINALRIQLKYNRWNVYGVSYGTYMAQVYASSFPDDVKTLTMDSPVADIAAYYTENTENYVNGLSRVFKLCENDPACNQQYPELERIYYETIETLEKNPITVAADKEVVESRSFTYNAGDFKLAIQQALYNKQLIEVIPLLIYQFHNGNKAVLKNLVPAFSGLLRMDYGMYYCVSCNEVLPNNSLTDFLKNAAQYKLLKGGLSFYQSDFKVCDKWNTNRKALQLHHDLSGLSKLSFPVIIFSGGFDPITPRSNGEELVKHFSTAYLVKADDFGHIPSYSKIGHNVANEFINNPGSVPDVNAFQKADKIQFVNNVIINKGICEIGNSLNVPDILFLTPLVIAFVLMLIFIVVYLVRLFKKTYVVLPDKIVRILTILSSVGGVLALASVLYAITTVASRNFYIIAFGLPADFNFVFSIIPIFIGLALLTMIYFLIMLSKINNRSILFSVIFSNILLSVYLLYWGIV